MSDSDDTPRGDRKSRPGGVLCPECGMPGSAHKLDCGQRREQRYREYMQTRELVIFEPDNGSGDWKGGPIG